MKRGSVFMLLEILIAAAIVLFLAQFVLKRYFQPASVNPQEQQFLQSQGLSTSTPRSAIDTTSAAVDQINRQQAERLKQLQEPQ